MRILVAADSYLIDNISIFVPVATCLVCFAYQPYVTRLNTQLTLRENFAAPWLWLQIALVSLFLQS